MTESGQSGQPGGTVLALVGPTGAGKSGSALRIASLLASMGREAVIINADSRQLYADFPIITAQPDTRERALCPHLLYGCLACEETSSARQWAEKARREVEAALATGRVPMLVGGTGLYLRALLDGMADIPPIDPAIRTRLQQECAECGPHALHRRLRDLDPACAARIHPNDRQRILRALEVRQSTGRSLSAWHAHNDTPPNWHIARLGIGLPLAELEPLLRQRIDAMMAAGAMEEARAALERCPDTRAPGWSGIGCAELAACLLGDISLDECLQRWQHNTRAYAKRQWTWFRADTRIAWLRPGDRQGLEQAVAGAFGGMPPAAGALPQAPQGGMMPP